MENAMYARDGYNSVLVALGFWTCEKQVCPEQFCRDTGSFKLQQAQSLFSLLQLQK